MCLRENKASSLVFAEITVQCLDLLFMTFYMHFHALVGFYVFQSIFAVSTNVSGFDRND